MTKTKTMTPARLREIRKGLKLTQRQFAERIGMTVNTICLWEKGKVTIKASRARMIEAAAAGRI